LIEIGWKLGQTLDEAKALETEGRELAERAGDLKADARLRAAYAMAELFRGEVESGLARLEKAAGAAEQAEDAELNALLRGRLAYMYLLSGRLEESLALMNELLEAHTRSSPTDLSGENRTDWLRGFRALPLMYMGECSKAAELLDTAIAEAERGKDNLADLGTLHGFEVTLAWFRGDRDAGLRHAKAQVELAETRGVPGLLSGAYDSMGVAYLMNESFREAAEYGERALSIARDTGTLLQSEAVFVANVAAVRLGVGDVEMAVSMAEEAAAIAVKRGTPLFECRALLVLARALLALDEVPIEQTTKVVARALEIVERTGARGYEPFLHVEAARLARLKGEASTGDDEIACATRQFRAMGAGAHVERLEQPGDGRTN